ncbi:hypothetical protein [Wenxinia marina]|uniref:Uncharacterized protein n=1 Tax=Wenxinia marina DSM 24838 TaxID=1123501 RepID=A0A0D0NGM2_9RHOB|nr:hypothetical protein [Wenxinia marina]KIQ67470.1 hypothetical protein Wenmar_03893 [Wenxinia marina DSM 24838]GGL69271.1 hypothetical protein GCM10011392_24650 [Wenxinia marina]
MTRTTLILAAAALASAGVATAQQACPTADSLARGIRVEFEGGTTEIFRSADPGVIRVDGIEGGEQTYRMEVAQGTHLLRYEALLHGVTNPSTVVTYDYGMPPLEMPVPSPGGRWQIDVAVDGFDGERQEAQSQVYDAERTDQIGGCTYRVVPVLIAYATSDTYIEAIDYLPELGIGYMVWNESDGVRSDPLTPIRLVAGK